MDIFLSADGDRSLVAQIHDQLRDGITDGRLPVGASLTPSRALAIELDVSRSTVTQAYERLATEGYVEGRRGGGTVVVGGAVRRPSTSESAGPGVVATLDRDTVRPYGTRPTRRARFDLAAGRIDPGLFPTDTWRRCVLHALRSGAEGVGRYGDPVGSDTLRRALTHWIAQTRGIATTPDRVVVTQGTGHTVDLLARALLRPGDVAAVEEPGYPPVTSVLRARGVRVVGVPVDEDGLVVEALPTAARLVHVTPTHHFPLGSVMSLDRRLALVDWARRHDVVVVEDDYDSDFRYVRRPVEPLHHLDDDGRIIYAGTFSKILSPTLRMAFAVLPPGLVPVLTSLRQAIDGGPPVVIDHALARFIDQGHLGRHLRRSRRVYAARQRLVVDELRRLAPADARTLPAHTGLHVTLVAPSAPDDDTIVARAVERDLLVSTLRRTYQFSTPVPGVVVGFGAIATDDVTPALERLATCLSTDVTARLDSMY